MNADAGELVEAFQNIALQSLLHLNNSNIYTFTLVYFPLICFEGEHLKILWEHVFLMPAFQITKLLKNHWPWLAALA